MLSRTRCLVFSSLFGLILSQVAAAAPIGLVSLLPKPYNNDIASEYVSVNFTHATGAFVADGTPAMLGDNYLDSYLNGEGSFHLTATISQATSNSPVTITNASLVVLGDPEGTAHDDPHGVLYSSAHLKQFGYYSGTYSYWEFVFSGDNGSLVNSGRDIGVILSNQDAHMVFSDFTSSFSTVGGALSDTFVIPQTFAVPEPATLSLLAVAGLALLARKKS